MLRDRTYWLKTIAVGASLLVTAVGCDSDDTVTDASVDLSTTDGQVETGTDDATVEDATPDSTTGTSNCLAVAANFETLPSANANLPDPEVSAACDGDVITVIGNAIPDFPYIETSPGNPRVSDTEYVFPTTPTVAAATTDVPAVGAIGIAVNGIPIFGATEGAGGDVKSIGSGFVECGGHNGPSGYHFHTFDVNGSDDCRFTEEDAMAGHLLFGYAFDGYPIYSGNFQFTSSYELTDESLFATDTVSAHTYVDGLGDLDECNGRMDDAGNYAYYTTDTYPYTLKCYRGVPTENGPGGGGMMMMP